MRTSSADVRSRATAYASCHIAQVSFSAGCVAGSGADGREHQARVGIGPRLLECLKENVGRLGAGHAVAAVEHEEWDAVDP
jgi:hypothetical protein